MFVVTKHVCNFFFFFFFLSRQNNLVATKDVFCRDKYVLITTKAGFVTTCIFLSRQKTCFDVDKTFVATKMILVAAPANDAPGPSSAFRVCGR